MDEIMFATDDYCNYFDEMVEELEVLYDEFDEVDWTPEDEW